MKTQSLLFIGPILPSYGRKLLTLRSISLNSGIKIIAGMMVFGFRKTIFSEIAILVH
ncbi:hypothetical protein HanRHA438_Chr04g0173211 [Helianthus annuus]|nr:hypothetical protein HanHA89_Chr04g0147181 [Helianthus annuus]KAJ0926611.1 hypothetical protein HanRHA438_Chr04g0173211 [Helianthus annuus]KAJ0931088.1 hypothetical protein HanPSC8_Chr04g0157291 [Helianthus annuus]